MNEKEKATVIDLYYKGYSMRKIASELGYSRQTISTLIKQCNLPKNIKKIKVYKYKNFNKMSVYIPISYLKQIGISGDIAKDDYVNVSLENDKIVITKHK